MKRIHMNDYLTDEDKDYCGELERFDRDNKPWHPLAMALAVIFVLWVFSAVLAGFASAHEGGIKAVASGDVREDGKPDCRCHCLLVDKAAEHD